MRAWYHDIASCHQATADDAHRMLRAMLGTVVADHLIVANPCQVPGAGSTRAAEPAGIDWGDFGP